MATGTIQLPILGATLPDGSTNNGAPLLQRVKSGDASSSSLPNSHWVELQFDPTTNNHVFFNFRMPADYSSAPILKLQWKINATTGAVVWESRIGAELPTDAINYNNKALSSANSATSSVPAVARQLVETSISLTNNDSLAANSNVRLLIKRDAGNAADTATVVAELVAASLEYTTV